MGAGQKKSDKPLPLILV